MAITQTNNQTSTHQGKALNVGLISAILTVSGFLCMLNETVLNMALKSIMSQFDISAVTAQWLSTGYMLIMGVSIPVSAFFIQTIKTKSLYGISMLLFIFGTLVSGCASIFPVLLIGRLIQAVGTGMLIPNIVNTLIIINPEEKRGKALGVFNLVMFFAPAVGPVLSGIIIQTLNWKWLFFSILPFSIVALILGMRFLENVTKLSKMHLDVLSVLLSTIGFGGLIYGASNFGSANVLMALIPLLAGVISLLLFTIRQLNLREPMLDVRSFRYPMFSIGTLLIILMHMVNFSIMLLLPLFMEGAMGLSAFTAGLMLLPGGIINGIVAPIAGSLYDKHGPRCLIFPGFILSTIVFIILSRVLTVSVSIPLIIVLHCLSLVAVGMINTPTQTNSLNQLPLELYPHGTAITNTLQQIGGAFGTSLFIAIMTAIQKNYISDFGQSGASGQALALAAGVRGALSVAVVILAVALVLSFFVRRSSRNSQKRGIEIEPTELAE